MLEHANKSRMKRYFYATFAANGDRADLGGLHTMKKQRKISTYQKLCIPQYMISNRLKFLFPVPCSLCAAPHGFALSLVVTFVLLDFRVNTPTFQSYISAYYIHLPHYHKQDTITASARF